MAPRKPLVLLASGDAGELPAGDNLPGPVLDPSLLGVLAWTDDPAILSGSSKPASGTAYYNLAVCAASRASGANVTLTLEITVAGATLTASQNVLALYRSDGTTLTRLALFADQSAAWTVLGVKQVTAALSAALAVGDLLYLAALSVGTTTPTFGAAPGVTATLLNVGSSRRRATLARLTTLPATVALSSLVVATSGVGIIAS